MSVTARTRLVLWTRAGGRCQYTGCNTPLLGDLISGRDKLNKAYVAHIVADEPGGPRGDPFRSPELADDVDNVMLLCDPHHRLIDREDVDGHDEQRLRRMKQAHEARIEMVTGIEESRASHVLLYSARVGQHDCPVRFDLAKAAMLPDRYPAEAQAIQLEIIGSTYDDSEDEYWRFQVGNLQRQFGTRVRDRLSTGGVAHLSVFALAPQPLLIELGRLLSDIPAASVYQLHREPQDWRWRQDGSPVRFLVDEAGGGPAPKVALIIGLSATVTPDRVTGLLPPGTPIWTLSTERPNNDLIRRADDVAELRRTFRSVLDRIKARHGHQAELHVFPAMPVSAAVEFGRTWMPKADLPLVIYDERRSAGGFRIRHRIGVEAPTPALELQHA